MYNCEVSREHNIKSPGPNVQTDFPGPNRGDSATFAPAQTASAITERILQEPTIPRQTVGKSDKDSLEPYF